MPRQGNRRKSVRPRQRTFDCEAVRTRSSATHTSFHPHVDRTFSQNDRGRLKFEGETQGEAAKMMPERDREVSLLVAKRLDEKTQFPPKKRFQSPIRGMQEPFRTRSTRLEAVGRSPNKFSPSTPGLFRNRRRGLVLLLGRSGAEGVMIGKIESDSDSAPGAECDSRGDGEYRLGIFSRDWYPHYRLHESNQK